MTKFFGAALLAGAAMVAGPAGATIVTATYTGTVFSGYDVTGVFGAADTDLTGAAYTSVYTIDTDVGERYDGGGYDQVLGGAYYALSSPVSAILTINGVSVALDGAYYGLGYASAGAWETYAQDLTDDGLGNQFQDYLNETVTDNNLQLPENLETPFSYDVDDDNNGNRGGFLINGASMGNLYQYANGDLEEANLTVTVGDGTAAVPEPATWAMMIAGFGLVGGGARLRARRPALAAS